MTIHSKTNLAPQLRGAAAVLLAAVCLTACTEDIDMSARYVFTEETVASYLAKHEEYSQYVELLNEVNVSPMSQSTVGQLLTARGHYTVFAPTNEAIDLYLQSLVDKGLIDAPSWDAFPTDNMRDSIRQVVVLNSVIDGGDERYFEANQFPENDAEFPLPNMHDMRLRCIRLRDTLFINKEFPVDTRNYDIPATNGIVHQVHRVVAPDELTLADILSQYLSGEREGYRVMAMLCGQCGLMDTLRARRDDRYEMLYLGGHIEQKTPSRGLATMDGGYSYAPEHRKYAFTIFAEPDAFWEEAIGKPAADITPADVQQWVVKGGYYPDAVADEEYQAPHNVLYQWTTYHVLPFKLAPDRLVLHYNEKGYDYVSSPRRLAIPIMEYYVPLGERRLLKIYESPEAGGVYLNRFPVIDNARKGTGHELSCEPDKVGARVVGGGLQCMDSESVAAAAINGFLYAIDAPIAYDDATRDNLARTRLRMDCMSFFPEVMNNDIRRMPLSSPRNQWVHFPDDKEYRYIQNLSINEGSTFVYYNAYNYKFGSLCGDEVKCVGHWELVFTLPPVPRQGVYEVRYRILTNSDRGVAQFYFGDDEENLPVAGIPVNLTLGGANAITGWSQDTDDDDANNEIDKQMRNCGFMKGEESILILKNPGTTARANVNRNIVRRIVARQTLSPDKTYYLKIKTVLDNERSEFYMDHIEYCPKEIYDNPERPEDIW